MNKYLTFQAYLEWGEARKATFPPPPGLIGLALLGVRTSGQARVGGPERGSRAWRHAYTQGEALVARSLWKNCLLPRPSRPPCPGANHFRPRSLSLYPSSGDALQCGFNGQGLRNPPPPQAFSLSKGPDSAPCFPKSGGEAPASVSARAWQLPIFVPAGLESLLPAGFLIQFLSHINGKIWRSPGRPGASPRSTRRKGAGSSPRGTIRIRMLVRDGEEVLQAACAHNTFSASPPPTRALTSLGNKPIVKGVPGDKNGWSPHVGSPGPNHPA